MKSILFIMFANLKLVLRSYTSLYGIFMSASLNLFIYTLKSFRRTEPYYSSHRNIVLRVHSIFTMFYYVLFFQSTVDQQGHEYNSTKCNYNYKQQYQVANRGGEEKIAVMKPLSTKKVCTYINKQIKSYVRDGVDSKNISKTSKIQTSKSRNTRLLEINLGHTRIKKIEPIHDC